MDAILVGRRTAELDDPLLTARPPGVRTAARIVLDSQASLESDSQLVRTAREVPVIVACTSSAAQSDRKRLLSAGCEVLECPGNSDLERLRWLLEELGRRKLTNLLVEGGGQLLGSLFDAHLVDEVHVFIAPKIAGGRGATSPVGGDGVEPMAAALRLEDRVIEPCGTDVYVRGRVARGEIAD